MIFVDNDKCVEFIIRFIDINHVLLDFEFIKIIIWTSIIQYSPDSIRKLAFFHKNEVD